MNQTYLIPKNLYINFDELLKEYLSTIPNNNRREIQTHFTLNTKRGKITKFGKRNRERMIALFDLLHYRTVKFDEAWISFHTRKLLTPKRFKPFYLNFLLYHHYIEKISNYQVGIKNIGYKTITKNLEEYTATDNIEIGYRWKHIEAVKQSMYQFEISNTDLISGMKNYLSRCKYEGYNYTNEEIQSINESNFSKIIKGDISIEKYLKPSLSNLISGTLRTSRARFNGRISSTYTNIPREIRNKIRLKSGDPISELDMSSSQWAIFMLLADKFYGGVSDQFREDIRDNIFYDKLKNWHGLVSRDKAKKLSYTSGLFFEGSNYAYIPVISNLLEPYPREAEILIKMKSDFNNHTHKFKKLKVYNLSQLLQTIEAIIFVDTALVYCLNKSIPAFTVHDSIIVPAEYINEIKAVVLNKIKELFDIKLLDLRFKESIIL